MLKFGLDWIGEELMFIRSNHLDVLSPGWARKLAWAPIHVTTPLTS
jgi:hypothetical protein